MDTDLRALWGAALDELGEALRDSVLLVDEGAANALCWGVGLPALLALGVALSPEQLCLPGAAADGSAAGAVVLCSGYLVHALDSLRTSLTSPGVQFSRATLVSSFSSRTNAAATPAAADAAAAASSFQAIEELVSSWLRAASPGVDVAVHARCLELPVHFCPVGASLFVLPVAPEEAAEAQPLLCSDLGELRAAEGSGAPPPTRLEEVAWSQVL